MDNKSIPDLLGRVLSGSKCVFPWDIVCRVERRWWKEEENKSTVKLIDLQINPTFGIGWDVADMEDASNDLQIKWYMAWQEVVENSLYIGSQNPNMSWE
jgi:hypothetical protein